MIVVRAVGKVEPHRVHARVDELPHALWGGARRPQGAEDLAAARSRLTHGLGKDGASAPGRGSPRGRTCARSPSRTDGAGTARPYTGTSRVGTEGRPRWSSGWVADGWHGIRAARVGPTRGDASRRGAPRSPRAAGRRRTMAVRRGAIA